MRRDYIPDDLKYHVEHGEVEWIISEPSPLSDAGNYDKDDITPELRKY